MKALVLENFDSPYQLKEVDKPIARKDKAARKIQ